MVIGDKKDENDPIPLVWGTTVQKGQEPVYEDGNYGVFVGSMADPAKNDMDHFLIVNTRYGVIEASVNRLIEARAACWGLAKAEFEQDTRIHQAKPLIEEDKDSADPKRSKWN